MPVDSYKYLPRSFRSAFEAFSVQDAEPVWAPMPVPVADAKIALLSSGGFYLKDSQPSFDLERERDNPTWGDPTYRVIPRDVRQQQIGVAHLHINTRDLLDDFNVALPLRAFGELESDGALGELAEEHYSCMGFQEDGCDVWRTEFGPELVGHLKDAAVQALVLAPA